MRIKLTLLRTAADPADLAVTVDGTATVADLARTLAETDPVPTYYSQDELRDLTLRVHGTPGTDDRSTRLLLPEDVAAETVRSGSVVSLAQASRYDGSGADQPPAARLTVLDGPDAGLEVTLPEGTSIIGRGKGCDVRLSDPTVSKEHARLAVTDIIEIVDLRSANGLLM
ncbi:FHA domain-containing protein, partial [uncultured Georgenia sp.]|uniref:FHA domain-containing protein n=1 Tax=uncultured Georgenia sp. TaxID=378209 RepID=UPI002635BA40